MIVDVAVAEAVNWLFDPRSSAMICGRDIKLQLLYVS